MTGFARARSADGAHVWELKSVNGKGLEARLRLPPGYDRLEQQARAAIQKRFARGNIQAQLTVSRLETFAPPIVNEAFLRDVAGLAKRMEEQFGCQPARADGLLALRGVLEQADIIEDETTREETDRRILSVLDEALESLRASRLEEGAALATILAGHVDQIERLALAAEADGSREPAAIRARLAEQVRLLLDASPGTFDEGRLHAEAAFLATKADIREELDRLKTHAAGRRLDFLSQEFNREANTLCSKANSATVTAIGLDLKITVDQFREQIQNLE